MKKDRNNSRFDCMLDRGAIQQDEILPNDRDSDCMLDRDAIQQDEILPNDRDSDCMLDNSTVQREPNNGYCWVHSRRNDGTYNRAGVVDPVHIQQAVEGIAKGLTQTFINFGKLVQALEPIPGFKGEDSVQKGVEIAVIDAVNQTGLSTQLKGKAPVEKWGEKAVIDTDKTGSSMQPEHLTSDTLLDLVHEQCKDKPYNKGK